MLSPDDAFDIKEQQSAVLCGLIAAGGEGWKVLVYDQHCQELVAPTVRVGQLRELGVTLWLRLENDR